MDRDQRQPEDALIDDRPYSRRWLVRGAAAFAVAGGAGAVGLTRWAAAKDDDDSYDDDNSGPGNADDRQDRDDHDDEGHDDDGHDDHKDEDDDRDDDEVMEAPAAAPDEHRVEIRDEAFVPITITIAAGQWVTWVNLDDDEHTATGTDFDTGELDAGARAEVQFNTPGTYPYVCQFHAEMQGEVIVTGAGATPEASPQASPAASPVVGGEESAVSIIDFAFEPAILQIAAGTTVVWTNDGSAPHTVTGDFLESDALQSGDTTQHTFTEAGTFDYVCAFHPQMTGTIEVS